MAVLLAALLFAGHGLKCARWLATSQRIRKDGGKPPEWRRQVERHTVWPEGVIARYLTDAGKALADPSMTVDIIDRGSGDIDGQCRGCEETFEDSPYISDELGTVRHWAQEHAEKCRAMPKPAGRA